MTALFIQDGLAGSIARLTLSWGRAMGTELAADAEVRVLAFQDLVDRIDGPFSGELAELPSAREDLSHSVHWRRVRMPRQADWLVVLINLLERMDDPPDRALVQATPDSIQRHWAPDPAWIPEPEIDIDDEREGDAAMLEFEFRHDIDAATEEGLRGSIYTWLAVAAMEGFADPEDKDGSLLLPLGEIEVEGDFAFLALSAARVDGIAIDALALMVSRIARPPGAVRLRVQ